MQRPDPLVFQTKKVVAAVEGTSSEKGRVYPEECEEREVPATVQPAPLLSLDARTGQSQSDERIVVGESPIADPGEDGVGTPADKERFMTDKERFMALTLPEVDPESVQQTTDESEGDKVEFSQVGQTSYFEVPLTSSEIGQEGARADGGTCDIVESPVQDKGGMQPLHATEELAPSGARLGLSHVAPTQFWPGGRSGGCCIYTLHDTYGAGDYSASDQRRNQRHRPSGEDQGLLR
jgi:hypothetical protein